VFSVRTLADANPDAIQREQVQSRAGMVVLRRCGDAAGMLFHVVVNLRSPHGIVEAVVSSSRRALDSAEKVLPHRDPGTSTDAARPGPPPMPPPLATRVDAATARLSRSSESGVDRDSMRTDADGAAERALNLGPGCHRFVVCSEADRGDGSPPDVDAELVDATGKVVDSDRTESPDATLVTCVGEPRSFLLRFAGAAPRTTAVVLHAETPLPPHLPVPWGADAGARVARTLLERSLPGPQGPARFVSLGVAGTTSLVAELETGQCYLAGAATIQGDTRLLSLRLAAGRSAYAAHEGDVERATL